MTDVIHEPFWATKPNYLFNNFHFIPCNNCSMGTNMNRVTRCVLYISVIVAVVYKSTQPLYIGIILMGIIVILYFLSLKQMSHGTEQFSNVNMDSMYPMVNNIYNLGMDIRDTMGYSNVVPSIPYGYGYTGSLSTAMPQYYDVPPGTNLQNGLLYQPDQTLGRNFTGVDTNLPSPYTYPLYNYGPGPELKRVVEEVDQVKSFDQEPIRREPTKNNPFMNVMPIDYDAPPVFNDYNRYESLNYPSVSGQEVRQNVEDEFVKGLYQGPNGKLWDRVNSQRQYVSQPVGSVPNNQAEFANWLYAPNAGVVCKSGSIWSRYGVKYTDDSLACNGYNVSVPTNKGLLSGNLMSSVAK